MDWLKKINWTPLTIIKALGVVLLTLVVFSFISNVLSPMGDGFGISSRGSMMSKLGVPSMYQNEMGYSDAVTYESSVVMADDMMGYGGTHVQLSKNNIGMPMPEPSGPMGNDAEDYEVRSYSATIEARDSAAVCSEVVALKGLQYVIFENASENDRGCLYSFKVESDKTAEVLQVLESLDPKDFSESTYTIKQQLDDFTSETEILERKLAVINETLESAVTAYDEITQLATQTRDAESLATVISSKIATIERLTEQRIMVTTQLERLSRAKAEQMDRLVYTYFNVQVYENKFIDSRTIAESWKSAVREFVRDVNQTTQDVTINLVALLLVLLQYVLYFFVLLFVTKFVWRTAMRVWKQ